MLKRCDYDEIIEKLQDCVRNYEWRNISDFKYNLILSNGNSLKFEFSQKYIAHMLGVNTNFLKDYCSGENSYEILKNFLENSYMVFTRLMKNSVIDERTIFSQHIEEKIEVFKDNIFCNFYNILAIVEIDREKTYQNGLGEKRLMDADYLLFQKRNKLEDNYGILALHKEDDNYAILSSMSTTKEELEAFSHYLKKQNLMLPFQLQVTRGYEAPKKFWYSNEQFLKAYSLVKKMKDEYQMSLCLEKFVELFFNKTMRNQNETLEMQKFETEKEEREKEYQEITKKYEELRKAYLYQEEQLNSIKKIVNESQMQLINK